MPGILRLSEATALALHAAVLAAEAGEPLRTTEMASTLAASEAHLSKVLQTLTRAGILESKRGPNGGYVLRRDPEEVSLLDVYEALEGPIRSDGCLFSEPVCERVHCILGDLVESVRNDVSAYLKRTSLGEAARGRRR